MTISRRDLFKVGLAAGTAISIPSVLRAQASPGVARMVMGDLAVFDPIVTTMTPTFTHALAIYDSLFAYDSKFVSQPQMVEKWGISDDKMTYTFELRDGLGWHDGSAVTAADCVASIRRWGQVSPGGQLIMAHAKDISKKDDKTFTIALKEPLGILLDLLGNSDGFPMMREQDADRPATEQVTANIGSGPFKFNHALAKPGASFTYDKNEKYMPRKEVPDAYAGGKVVKVERVIWEIIADEQTAFAALQSGEVDFLNLPSADLYSSIESDPDLALQVLNTAGETYFMRMNCLQPPFDNAKARQAMLHLIDQEAFMRTSFPPEYISTVTSAFGMPYSNDENTTWFKKGGDPEKAKQLFNEAGYASEKVVILQRTDEAGPGNMAQLLATTLRKIGVNAELVPGDGGAVRARRENKGSVEEGGWSIFITSATDFEFSDPLSAPYLTMPGEKGWTGWPKSDEYEALRAKWANIETLEGRKMLARKLQKVWWDYVPHVLLGHTVLPVARRKTLTGLIATPTLVPLWNLEKAS
ncbi:ABC transporter substrate-binding protein [Mesorhizobium sp. NZP2234]|uniref:ABC transporter substrate-binding protein n=1 Tax=Mesorhizobium sp. NZP2234 TaxID=2483402 RepID=UPI00155611A7|nr:ABC transporter substrate-binding protein [Mesorhizobium sp. NZP2234]QKC92363.1 ABC transporter substrate-binding protein [Mesorhizobium sp. NZP2234]